MRERAGKWKRVSTKGQDEASQDPDETAWCEARDYEVTRNYEIHGGSAHKGNVKFDKAWAQVLEDFRTGAINVLVVWYLSRLDRKLAATKMIAEVVALGGRIEFVRQPHLNNLSTMAGRISLTIEQEIAYAESVEKTARINAKHDGLRTDGSVVGKPPWGYKIVKDADGRKILTPTEDGLKWVPVIFQMITDGKSLSTVARTLEANGVKLAGQGSLPSHHTIARLIRRTVYMGERPHAGNLKTEALVIPSVWRAANTALDNRPNGGRRTATKTVPALVAAVCGNPDCPSVNGHRSPMYRHSKRDANGTVFSYYRCSGIAPAKKVCGAAGVQESVLDALICEAMLTDYSLYMETVFIPGDDHAEGIAKLREQIALAARDGEYAKIAELSAEAQRLEQEPNRPSTWEPRYTDKTVSKHFDSLDLDGRRAFLRDYEITVWKPTKRSEPEITMVHRSLLVPAESAKPAAELRAAQAALEEPM